MRFTMAQPEVSCHPETLLPGARTVVSAAHCYYAPEPPLEPGEGRLARYTWHDGYAVLRRTARRAREAPGRRVPRPRRCEPARRPRGGGTVRGRLLRQEHDADHPPARLVDRARDARHDRGRRSDRTARARLRLVHALHRGVSDRSARRAGRRRCDQVSFVLDAGAGADPRGVPRRARRAGVRLRHLPGRLSLEPRCREAPSRPAAGRGRGAARPSRRLVAGRGRRGHGTLRPAVRAEKRRALPPPQRARRARQRRQRR